MELSLPFDEDYIIEIKPFSDGGDGSSSEQIRIPKISSKSVSFLPLPISPSVLLSVFQVMKMLMSEHRTGPQRNTGAPQSHAPELRLALPVLQDFIFAVSFLHINTKGILCLKNLEGTGLYVSPNKSSDFC